ncbi:unnamed protein product, partial [Effrenium voratum]
EALVLQVERDDPFTDEHGGRNPARSIEPVLRTEFGLQFHYAMISGCSASAGAEIKNATEVVDERLESELPGDFR